MKDFKSCFDADGNFKLAHFDPYRYEDYNVDYVDLYNKIFTPWDAKYGHGGINEGIWDSFRKWVVESNFKWCSDAVKLYYAQEMGLNTKGSYPAIYMWR